MDPLSHALLGAASGRSVARDAGRAALAAGLLGALLPDADVLIGSDADPLLTLEYHRQFTHSFVAAPVGALIVAAAIWFVMRRRIAFGGLYWPALAGYVSAIVLDACTSYGTQLLWPFTERRFAASIVAVVDPVVTIVLLAGVLLALRSRGAGLARASIAVVVVYLGMGWVQQTRVEALMARTAGERGHAIVRHEAKPTIGNLLLWRSVYLTGEDFVVDAVRVGMFSPPVIYPGGTARQVQPIDLVPPLAPGSVQAQDVVRFARVSDGYLARHPARPNVIGDVRYAMLPDSTEPLWGIAVHAERENEHVELRTFRELTPQKRERFLAMLKGASAGALETSAAKIRIE